MTTVRTRVVAALTLGIAAAPPIACSLDFDRYDPLEGGDGAHTGPLPINVDAGYEARADAGGNNAPADASAHDAQTSAPCSAPTQCFQQAGTCGMACRQTFQNCSRRCGDVDVMCEQSCTNARQMCLGRCASTCVGCTTDAGCVAANDCLDATNS